MAYIETITFTLSIVTLAGILWYSLDLSNKISEGKKPLEELTSAEATEKPREGDLSEIGTGPMAEEALGIEISKAQTIVFVAGGMNRTIFNLLRYFLSPNVPLQVLVNPRFGKVYINEIMTKFQSSVKKTDELKGDTLDEPPTYTVFCIDGKVALLFRETDHAAFIAYDKNATTRLTSPMYQLWTKAENYTP